MVNTCSEHVKSSENSSQFDAVIVLGGGLGSITTARVKRGVEVVKSCPCSRLILVGSDEEVEFMVRRALELGVNENVLFYSGGSRNTVDNAYYAKKILEKINAKKVALVTSEFHMERALAIFEWVLGEEYKVTPIPVQDNPSREAVEREEVLKMLIPFLKKLFRKGDDENIKKWASRLQKILNMYYKAN
jgi:uncharacterized SAM-binding protein YcdF (DUF218 family)